MRVHKHQWQTVGNGLPVALRKKAAALPNASDLLKMRNGPGNNKGREMTLGELEFKAERIAELLTRYTGPNGQIAIGNFTEDLNADLRERLEKAPKVYSSGASHDFGNTIWIDDPDQMSDEPTQTARLVCVEEIKK